MIARAYAAGAVAQFAGVRFGYLHQFFQSGYFCAYSGVANVAAAAIITFRNRLCVIVASAAYDPKNGNSATEDTEEHREIKGLQQLQHLTILVTPTNDLCC